MKHLAPSPVDRVQMTIRISRSLRDRLKRESLNKYQPMQAIIERAVEQGLRRPAHITMANELFSPEFMVSRLKKQHLRRADYYDA